MESAAVAISSRGHAEAVVIQRAGVPEAITLESPSLFVFSVARLHLPLVEAIEVPVKTECLDADREGRRPIASALSVLRGHISHTSWILRNGNTYKAKVLNLVARGVGDVTVEKGDIGVCTLSRRSA